MGYEKIKTKHKKNRKGNEAATGWEYVAIKTATSNTANGDIHF